MADVIITKVSRAVRTEEGLVRLQYGDKVRWMTTSAYLKLAP